MCVSHLRPGSGRMQGVTSSLDGSVPVEEGELDLPPLDVAFGKLGPAKFVANSDQKLHGIFGRALGYAWHILNVH